MGEIKAHTITSLKEYLETMDGFQQKAQKLNGNTKFKYTIYGLILKYGHPFQLAPLPRKIKRGEMKECYWNSASRAMTHEGYIYVEGIASHVMPVQHAWLTHVDHPDLAYDPTWKYEAPGKEKYGPREYYGIPFNLAYTLRCLTQTGAVIDNWHAGYPLLSGEDNVEEEKWTLT